MCTAKGEANADKLDEEFQRVEDAAKELVLEAKQLDRMGRHAMAKAKREEATELLQSRRNLGEGMDYGYPAPI